MWTDNNKQNKPDNVSIIDGSTLKKYVELGESDVIKSGDFVYIYDEWYVEIVAGSILCGKKISKYSRILRKKTKK